MILTLAVPIDPSEDRAFSAATPIRGHSEEKAIVVTDVSDRPSGVNKGLALLDQWFQTLNIAWRPNALFVGPDIGLDQKPGFPRKRTFGEVLRDIMGKHTIQTTLPEPGSRQALVIHFDTQTKLLTFAEVLLAQCRPPRAEIYPVLGTEDDLTESTKEPTEFASEILRRFKFLVQVEIGKVGEAAYWPYWFDVRYGGHER